MAWRLKQRARAPVSPRYSTPQFRERPTKKPHDTTLIQRPLPFAVTAALVAASQAYSWDHDVYPQRVWRAHDSAESVTLSNDLASMFAPKLKRYCLHFGGCRRARLAV